MKILRACDHKQMPWKNGGGTTTEIAVGPIGTGVDNFDWRISMASIASDGPFSSFADVDRTLTILSGAGINLATGGAAPIQLTQDTPPLQFPGDVPTSAELIAGPVTDLNVMTRRRRWSHNVESLAVHGTTIQITDADVFCLFCCSGHLQVAGNERVLDPHDVLLIHTTDHIADISIAGQANILIVRLLQNHLAS